MKASDTSAGDHAPAAAINPTEPLNKTTGALFSRLKHLALPKRTRASAPSIEVPRVLRDPQRSADRHCLVIGNCQARPLATAMQVLCPSVVYRAVELPTAVLAQRLARRDEAFAKTLSEYDGLLMPTGCATLIATRLPELIPKIACYPLINFAAYHPDLVYINGGGFFGPLGQYNSAIALWGYLKSLSVTETVALFNARTYEVLGYHRFWRSSYESVLNEGLSVGLRLEHHLDQWSHSGCFMHSINHPKIQVFLSLAQDLHTRYREHAVPEAARYATDDLADGPVWPVYPEIGDRLGVEGNYLFKIEKGRCAPGRSVTLLDLREFIEGSFDAFGKYERSELRCDRLESERFEPLASKAQTQASRSAGTATVASKPRVTPYTDLPAHQFWRSAVAAVPWRDVDPVVRGAFQVTQDTRIATAGSCFAQNISAALQRFGFNYFVAERADELPADEAQRRSYGVYSARYGNVYTARQLLQLLERAYGRFHPIDTAWLRPDGRFIDPFRPLIEPDGFASVEQVERSRATHLAEVRALFEQLDVLIFTLGLTEAWTATADGAVFPVAPGVVGGAADLTRYGFVNFQVADVVRDLQRFLAALRAVNQRARMILTVSPVPLIATYEPQHALVATTYSKSVLRAAAGEICASHENCAYFPSYEIVTGNYARGAYYDKDLRTVRPAGVEHVMRLFFKHYAGDHGAEPIDQALMKELDNVREIFCDEQAIES